MTVCLSPVRSCFPKLTGAPSFCSQSRSEPSPLSPPYPTSPTPPVAPTLRSHSGECQSSVCCVKRDGAVGVVDHSSNECARYGCLAGLWARTLSLNLTCMTCHRAIYSHPSSPTHFTEVHHCSPSSLLNCLIDAVSDFVVF